MKDKEYFEKRLKEEKDSIKLLDTDVYDERNFLSCPEPIKDKISEIRKNKLLKQYPHGVKIEIFDLGRKSFGILLPKEKQEDYWLKNNYLIYHKKGMKCNSCAPAFKINVLDSQIKR